MLVFVILRLRIDKMLNVCIYTAKFDYAPLDSPVRPNPAIPFCVRIRPSVRIRPYASVSKSVRPSESGHTLPCPNLSVRPNPAIPFCVRIHLSVSENRCSEIGIFPISEQKTTLPGKVNFFKKGYVAGQCNTFPEQNHFAGQS